ncbi:MAG: Gfo/Idh/MocA family oxidoreductase [Alphaproteobacteria bacterium]|nr:Gfo/Idh/MocA family oxidoreductase [Alphaproteobacteria bacterium]
MDKIRYAVVGAGWISQIAFMPSVPQTGNSAMTAIITGNATNAAKLAAFHGIEHVWIYDDYDDALASGQFDAVYIGLPNSLHADYAVSALKAGIHALVEKPLAVSVEECEAMIAAAKEGGALLMTAYRLHCEPGTVEAIRMIREGAIGTPRFFSSIFSFQTGEANHRLKAEHWGGPLQDIGVYCLNAARHVFGAEPTLAIAMKGHGDDPRFSEVEETISATLRFPGDAIATFTASFNAAEIDIYRIIGTEGEIEMQPGFRFETPTRMILRREGEVTETTFPDIDHFGAQTAYFSDCIRNNHPPEPDGAEGLADVRALLAIEAAAKTGEPQPIDTPPRLGHPTADMVRMVERTDRRLVL